MYDAQRASPETPLDLPDDELVRRARRGDREAFAVLIRRYERPALAVAFTVLAALADQS